MNRRSNVIHIYDAVREESPQKKAAGYVFWNAGEITAKEAERLKTFFDHCNFIRPITFFNSDCELAEYLKGKGISVRVLDRDNQVEHDPKIMLLPNKGISVPKPFGGNKPADFRNIFLKNRFQSNRHFRNILKEYNLEFVQCYGRDAFEHYAFGAKLAGTKVVCCLPETDANGKHSGNADVVGADLCVRPNNQGIRGRTHRSAPTLLMHVQSKLNSFRRSLPLILSDKILVNSVQQYNTLEEQSRRLFASMQNEFSQRVAVVRPGVNLERYYPVDVIDALRLRQKLGINIDAKVVAFLGEFSPQNKQLEFLQQVCLKFSAAAASGQSRRTDFYFATQNTLPYDLMAAETDGIFAEPQDLAALQSYPYLLKCCDFIDSLNLRGRIFLEAIGKDQKFLDLLRAIDIAVLSPEMARDEVLLAKILSLGKPVVAIDTGEQTAEFIEEHGCGKVCSTYDFSTVFDGIYELVRDDILYKQSCNNARMVARHLFDANYTASEYEKEVLELVTAALPPHQHILSVLQY